SWSYYYDSDGNSRVKSHHVLLLSVIIAALVIFHFRHKIAEAHDRYRTRRRSGGYLGLSGFQDDIERGLTSSTFDLEQNIASSDSRLGLLEAATQEITRIMRREGLTFDQARLAYTQRQLDSNGIDKDGVPRDPKLVTF
ncbi:uncharacterized protein CANTADRAFT_39643, partial [Suhomyces tanzawaensis NRRL Y-17324]